MSPNYQHTRGSAAKRANCLSFFLLDVHTVFFISSTHSSASQTASHMSSVPHSGNNTSIKAALTALQALRGLLLHTAVMLYLRRRRGYGPMDAHKCTLRVGVIARASITSRCDVDYAIIREVVSAETVLTCLLSRCIWSPASFFSQCIGGHTSLTTMLGGRRPLDVETVQLRFGP